MFKKVKTRQAREGQKKTKKMLEEEKTNFWRANNASRPLF
jgi:hypothetical protein